MYDLTYLFLAAVTIAPERPASLASRSWEQSALTTVAPSLVACRMSGECIDATVTQTIDRHVTQTSGKSTQTWTRFLIQVCFLNQIGITVFQLKLFAMNVSKSILIVIGYEVTQ